MLNYVFSPLHVDKSDSYFHVIIECILLYHNTLGMWKILNLKRGWNFTSMFLVVVTHVMGHFTMDSLHYTSICVLYVNKNLDKNVELDKKEWNDIVKS